jgi:riboflavin synthase
MFTGIIESSGIVRELAENGSNRTFWIESKLTPELKVDQSLAHDGVCLTVEAMHVNMYKVTAVAETLSKTNIAAWQTGRSVNLERSLLPTTRLDGHFVQGHVDAIGTCSKIKDVNGSWEFEFAFPKEFAELVIEKGSIALNGISLTVFNVKKHSFRVAVIPYTFEHTNMNSLQKGDSVNLEFDVIGKYLLRKLSLSK